MTLALSCLALPFLRFVLPVSVFVSCVNLEKIVLEQPFHAQISRAGPIIGQHLPATLLCRKGASCS